MYMEKIQEKFGVLNALKMSKSSEGKFCANKLIALLASLSVSEESRGAKKGSLLPSGGALH